MTTKPPKPLPPKQTAVVRKRKPSRTVRVDRKTLRELRETGQMMSNVFFNWKQQVWRLQEGDFKLLNGLQERWDALQQQLKEDPTHG